MLSASRFIPQVYYDKARELYKDRMARYRVKIEQSRNPDYNRLWHRVAVGKGVFWQYQSALRRRKFDWRLHLVEEDIYRYLRRPLDPYQPAVPYIITFAELALGNMSIKQYAQFHGVHKADAYGLFRDCIVCFANSIVYGADYPYLNTYADEIERFTRGPT